MTSRSLPKPLKKILVHVEDPGATNFMIPLVSCFGNADWAGTVIASGLAADYLAERGVDFEPLVQTGTEAELLVVHAPNLLLVGTSENPQAPAFAFIEAARRAGIPSVAAIDGPANLAERFRGTSSNSLRHAPDWLLLTENIAMDEFERLGFSTDRMIVTGHPYFDFIREEGRALMNQGNHRARQLPEAPPDRQVIVFLSEGSDGLDQGIKRRSADYTLSGWGGSDRRSDIILEEFLDAVAALDEEPWLVLRLHPKETQEMYSNFLHRFQKISSGGNALSLLCACDLVVGLSTSLLSEAAILGLRTLSILPHDAQRDLILTVREGITPCATNQKSVQRMLREQLRANPPSFEEVDQKIKPGATAIALAALETATGIH